LIVRRVVAEIVDVLNGRDILLQGNRSTEMTSSAAAVRPRQWRGRAGRFDRTTPIISHAIGPGRWSLGGSSRGAGSLPFSPRAPARRRRWS